MPKEEVKETTEETLSEEEVLKNEIKELEEQCEELKNERMTARRRATKAENDAKEEVEKLKQELELANDKSAVYFRKMREAQDKLENIKQDVLSTIELTADGLANVHKLLSTSGRRLSKSLNQQIKAPQQPQPVESEEE
jgi:DNA repair exonuclease SbcCD ATPase subunit